MRFTVAQTVLEQPMPVFELPGDVTVTTYSHGSFLSVSFFGITPAQLHDAIGCPQADGYLRVVAAARAWLADFDNRYDGEGLPNLREIEELQAAITALDAARKVTNGVGL